MSIDKTLLIINTTENWPIYCDLQQITACMHCVCTDMCDALISQVKQGFTVLIKVDNWW